MACWYVWRSEGRGAMSDYDDNERVSLAASRSGRKRCLRVEQKLWSVRTGRLKSRKSDHNVVVRPAETFRRECAYENERAKWYAGLEGGSRRRICPPKLRPSQQQKRQNHMESVLVEEQQKAE